MRERILRLLAASVIIVVFDLMILGQTTGSIAGTVVDSNGSVVPNATVVVRGPGGQEYTVVTGESGSYRVPSVGAGQYSVAVTAPNFKRTVIEEVKVDVGLPTTVNATLQAGEVSETVTVTGGGEVLQTQTATIGTTITGRQITETPIASRDALDLILNLPGTATVGRPRTSSINGLPKGSLSITIDGVDVQDSLLRSSDGFFTYVRPRVDAIEEVTVSTANPGAESSGEGAVQIKFVTRRGTNNYRGGLFWQHRNTDLNAAYWFNNRDGQPVDGKALRTRIILNQYGGNFSGPIPFLKFGESSDYFDSGKNKRFFFVNYEEFRIPDSVFRTRVVMTPQAASGIYTYIGTTPGSGLPAGCTSVSGTQMECQRNVLSIAAAASQLSTADPTVAALLSDIRSATASTGTFTPITVSASLPNVFNKNIQNYNFQPAGMGVRKFLAIRTDFNLTKDHSLENVINWNDFVPSKDFLNGAEERFPGFPSYGQGSIRYSNAIALRSTFGQSIVNEARYTFSGGLTNFFPELHPDDFALSRGYSLGIGTAFGITAHRTQNSNESRVSPTFDFTDSVTWIRGSHSISFGGQWKRIKLRRTTIGRLAPSVVFGLDSSTGSPDLPAFNMFSASSLPGATAAQLTEARNLYAVLVGRITGYTSTAFLTDANEYVENAPQLRRIKQDTYGLYIQDTWRMRPNLTLNYGVRWQPQTAFITNSSNFARLENFEQAWGVSGFGNLFMPGTLAGETPRVVAAEIGEKAFNDDNNNFAPSVGVVWSPDMGDNGLAKRLFGGPGKSVFRGGYSASFVREGTNLLLSILGANPGGSLSASRSIALGNLTAGTNLRDPNNPNLNPAPFPSTPSYPRELTVADGTNAFDPNVKTGTVHSFSFGYQRELDRNTVVELRYVGNRGIDLQRQHNINELNTIENGFAAEFRLAQANLYANIAAGQGATFRYRGPGTGTSPLPLILAYIHTPTASSPYNPSNAALYTSSLFSNTTLVQQLSVNAPSVLGFAGNIENNGNPTATTAAAGGRRRNALLNGLPANFFYVNPATPGGSFIIDNTQQTWYDSGIIEVRRRLSAGLRVQASYTWSKAMSNAFQSSSEVFSNYTHREGGLDLAKNVQAFDIRHQFKFDASYDVPIGRGRSLFGGINSWADAFIGGWTILPVVRWQSGPPISFGNVQLVGMTAKELQKEIGVRKGADVVTWLPDDIILNSQRAFSISVTGAGGYGTSGPPEGRFIAPAGYGNCQSRFAGECGFSNLVLYGPHFFKFDVSLSKKFRIGETRSIEIRATALDALNMPNFRVGGWAADTVGAGCCGSTFGQLGNGTAYLDTSTTNDPGGRVIDLMLRINF